MGGVGVGNTGNCFTGPRWQKKMITVVNMQDIGFFIMKCYKCHYILGTEYKRKCFKIRQCEIENIGHDMQNKGYGIGHLSKGLEIICVEYKM